MSRTLVVVAHADDETLWCGGWLLQNPGTDICVATVPRNDPRRLLDFFAACEALGGTGYVCGRKESHHDVTAAQVFADSYDDIITHNVVGEYGHKLHVKLYCAMIELKKPMRVFNYGLVSGEPIDIDAKLAALACYTTRPNVLERMTKRFDLSKECLIQL